MNTFLVSAGPTLAAGIPLTPFQNTFTNFLTSLKFVRITVDETIEVINSIDIRKSSAIDCFTQITTLFQPPPTCIIYQSMLPNRNAIL